MRDTFTQTDCRVYFSGGGLCVVTATTGKMHRKVEVGCAEEAMDLVDHWISLGCKLNRAECLIEVNRHYDWWRQYKKDLADRKKQEEEEVAAMAAMSQTELREHTIKKIISISNRNRIPCEYDLECGVDALFDYIKDDELKQRFKRLLRLK